MADERARAHLLIGGRVQGVAFRDSARQMAGRLGLAGWVRNLADGRVEAVFEGPAGAVEAALDWCRHGPPGARVSGVEVWAEEPVGEAGFRILRTDLSRMRR